MDNRTLKFAQIYELEAKAQWAGVGRAVTRGLGKALTRGVGALAEGAGALRGGAGAVSKGLGAAERAATKGIATGVGAAANAERAVAKTTANLAKKFISKVETSPEAKKILTESKLRIIKDPRTKVETLFSIHGDQSATLKALRQAGYHPSDIRGAVKAARQTFVNTKKLAKIRAWQIAKNRSANNLENMVATAFTGGGIKNLLARNPVKSAIAVSLGLGALYVSFTGKPAAAQTPDGQEIVKSISTSNGAAIIPELIGQIDVVSSLATDHPDVVQALNAAKSALTELFQATLSVDDPASGAAFTQKVQAAEVVVNAAFEKVEELEAIVGDKVPQIDELQGGFGEFLVSVNQARTSIASSKVAAAYIELYRQRIVKEAAWQLLLLVPVVGNLIDTMIASSANVDKVKQKINRMVEMIDERGKEKDGFGKFKDVFTTFRNNAKTTADLIDGMIHPPSNSQDPTQIQNCQKFVEAAGNTVASFDSVTGALNELQGFWGGVGNFMQAAVGGWGGNWNDYQEFSQLVKQTKDPLAALQGQVSSILDKAQAQTPATTTKPADEATGLAGMANITL
ncbi:hypothetical protein M0R72_02325 [Candidatus Pacearchaeota archaeon]|jgi:hypothetical protein|nr:hypothetical protein [Candidatus Pacearchaeota archaeon]